jgi:hypothetical protein
MLASAAIVPYITNTYISRQATVGSDGLLDTVSGFIYAVYYHLSTETTYLHDFSASNGSNCSAKFCVGTCGVD